MNFRNYVDIKVIFGRFKYKFMMFGIKFCDEKWFDGFWMHNRPSKN